MAPATDKAADGPGRNTPPAMKDRFTFLPGQACFDAADLDVPTGKCIEVLRLLVEAFGQVVPYGELPDNHSPNEASDQQRAVKAKLKKRLEAKNVPCRIQPKRGEGYILAAYP
jgi:DNA-binding response OmpR family regulator